MERILFNEGDKRTPPLGGDQVTRVTVEEWSKNDAERIGFNASGVLAVARNKEGFVLGVKALGDVDEKQLKDPRLRKVIQVDADQMWGLD